MANTPRVISESPLPRYRVLLVDDDAHVLRSMAAALEFEFEVTTCESAERALTLARQGDFHVVCSDYSMSGASGLELLEQVARLPIPVGCLLVTGSTSFSARRSTANHYMLMKPVDPERLTSMILQLARTAEMKRNVGRPKVSAGGSR